MENIYIYWEFYNKETSSSVRIYIFQAYIYKHIQRLTLRAHCPPLTKSWASSVSLATQYLLIPLEQKASKQKDIHHAFL